MQARALKDDTTSKLDRMRSTWNYRGRARPMHSVCTGAAWNLSASEFFESGSVEVELILSIVRHLDLPLKTGTALDFGCGIGRLTQALASHFGEVVGVDISDEMIRSATAWQSDRGRVRFIQNAAGNLSMFPDNAFDFIVSDLVFQHIDHDVAENYLADLMRLLSPLGIAVLQIPGVVERKGIARRFAARHAFATSGIEKSHVQRTVQAFGGRVVEARTSSVAYAGILDILDPKRKPVRRCRRALRQFTWRLLADRRQSIAYVIQKLPPQRTTS